MFNNIIFHWIYAADGSESCIFFVYLEYWVYVGGFLCTFSGKITFDYIINNIMLWLIMKNIILWIKMVLFANEDVLFRLFNWTLEQLCSEAPSGVDSGVSECFMEEDYLSGLIFFYKSQAPKVITPSCCGLVHHLYRHSVTCWINHHKIQLSNYWVRHYFRKPTTKFCG